MAHASFGIARSRVLRSARCATLAGCVTQLQINDKPLSLLFLCNYFTAGQHIISLVRRTIYQTIRLMSDIQTGADFSTKATQDGGADFMSLMRIWLPSGGDGLGR